MAITPACANVTPLGAIALSAVAGVCSALAVGLKYRIGLDDSLDVCGVHLVSGIVGTVALGFLAIPSEGRAGLLHGGGWGLMGSQLAATVFVALYTGVLTLLIGLVLQATMGLRITKLTPMQGFCAETGGAATLFIATYLGVPVSTTHTITGAIVGVGASQKASAMRTTYALALGTDCHAWGS